MSAIPMTAEDGVVSLDVGPSSTLLHVVPADMFDIAHLTLMSPSSVVVTIGDGGGVELTYNVQAGVPMTVRIPLKAAATLEASGSIAGCKCSGYIEERTDLS